VLLRVDDLITAGKVSKQDAGDGEERDVGCTGTGRKVYRLTTGLHSHTSQQVCIATTSNLLLVLSYYGITVHKENPVLIDRALSGGARRQATLIRSSLEYLLGP
jgi:hypothetical protein